MKVIRIYIMCRPIPERSEGYSKYFCKEYVPVNNSCVIEYSREIILDVFLNIKSSKMSIREK